MLTPKTFLEVAVVLEYGSWSQPTQAHRLISHAALREGLSEPKVNLSTLTPTFLRLITSAVVLNCFCSLSG